MQLRFIRHARNCHSIHSIADLLEMDRFDDDAGREHMRVTTTRANTTKERVNETRTHIRMRTFRTDRQSAADYSVLLREATIARGPEAPTAETLP
jgi:hypothetical protein